MTTEISVPSFNFSAFYYPDILEALIEYKRLNVPELTDESAEEPTIQLLRAFALVGHLNNTLIDLVANEAVFRTAKLAESVRDHLRLIAFEMSPATPSQTDIIYELSKVFTSSFEIIPDLAQASTKREGTNPIIYFEALGSVTITRTDKHTYVLAEENGSFTDYTTEANSPTTPADDWQPWSSPASKDAIYWGHDSVMWNELSAFLTTHALNITGVFEFYDGDWQKTAPTSVTDNGSSLEFDLTSLLGASNRQNTKVRVFLNSTGAYEEVFSTWSGTKNIATTGLLGQSTPSTEKGDYTVGSDWTILEVTDGPSNFTQDGKVEFEIPQTEDLNWSKGTVDGKEAFWLRYRIISVAAPTAPIFQYTRMDEGKQYVKKLVTQGRSYDESPFSSTGLSGQSFELSKEYFIWLSDTGKIKVEGEVWTRKDNFLNSALNDKHYVIKLGQKDRATIYFGGPTAGKVPPVGVGNITASYRYGAKNNGNVGANTVTVDKTGLTYINKLWNPRQAVGWQEADGSTEESLEQVKVEGPASLKTKEIAIGPDDVVELTKRFVDENGASPFSRAAAIEEGYGPKTIELVVVAAGGGIATAEQLEALEEYFNGNKYAVPPKKKHLVANQEVVAVNYTQKLIAIDVTVYGEVTEAAVKNRLIQVIQPEALKEDGVTYEWKFGAKVPTSRISHEVFKLDDSITDVDVNTPSSDISLFAKELPKTTALLITVNVIEP